MKKSQIHSLPGGGYRDAATSSAVYPLVDHQGSVRAYAGTSGVVAAYDIGVGSSFNASYSWNSDGSYTANLSASMSVPLPGVPLWANFGGGYSYNSETGHALTGQMGACSAAGAMAMTSLPAESAGSIAIIRVETLETFMARQVRNFSAAIQDRV